MATANQFRPPHHAEPEVEVAMAIARERQKSWLLRTWIFSGLFFMAVPGTLLGFSNLMAISSHHGLSALPAAWMEGHGHAQVFGWIGSFILGIGFYSQPSRGRSSVSIPLASLVLWTTGVAMRWIANIYGVEWRVLLPFSAGFELISVMLFLLAASHHKMPAQTQEERPRRGIEPWMMSVLLGTTGLVMAVVFNFTECLQLALHSPQPAFPHSLDQKYLLLLGWGFIVPTVWGFSARWLPSFLSIPKSDAAMLRFALAFDVAAILCGIGGFQLLATILLTSGAVIVTFALRLVERPKRTAKVQGIHSSFPVFIRASYVWQIVAAGMSVWATYVDRQGGIWGASRHALTVGFAATMVFAIAPRILPHFAGVRAIFSKRLMFLSLILLQTGCTLRVCSEPLAYEGFANFAWKVLPFSGVLELSAVLIFAINLSLTFLAGTSSWSPTNSQNIALVNISYQTN